MQFSGQIAVPRRRVGWPRPDSTLSDCCVQEGSDENQEGRDAIQRTAMRLATAFATMKVLSFDWQEQKILPEQKENLRSIKKDICEVLKKKSVKYQKENLIDTDATVVRFQSLAPQRPSVPLDNFRRPARAPGPAECAAATGQRRGRSRVAADHVGHGTRPGEGIDMGGGPCRQLASQPWPSRICLM